MLTCSITGDVVYRSAYKDLSTKEGEIDPRVMREKLDELVCAGRDEMTVTTLQGVKVVATTSQQTAIGVDGNTKSIHLSFSQPSIKMDLVVDRDVNHCDLSLYRSGHCDLLLYGFGLFPGGSSGSFWFGIAALKDRESGRYETPEGLDLHSRLDNVNTNRMVLSKEVTVVFKDQFSGIERDIPVHYGEVFLKRGYDDEDLLIHGVEMMTPSW
ncbi:hypothetical protein Q5P01_020012 [Channa striata]|uniref:Uncharacterized protein n=1 Tax=Channa striata TaxID=64152 RepID=A0AA88LWW6_CHASR|nr:hypothetical protein Q5P01_020012 [Channa striata]